MTNDDFKLGDAYKKKTGQVLKLEDIDGVGPTLAKRISAATGTRNPKEVAEYSPGQLADMVTGVSRQMAAKIIRRGGGSAHTSKRSGGSNVLNTQTTAAMRTMPVGDFQLDLRDQDSAEAKHDFRSQTARRTDRNERAPITTDLDKWKENKAKYDYPGVDTPTEEPGVLPKDFERGGPFETSEQASETFASESADIPVDPVPRTEEVMEREQLASMDISANPGEVFEGKHSQSAINDGMGGPNYNANLGEVVETDRPESEQKPPMSALREQSRGTAKSSGELYDFPDWTVSRGQTYLNEKVHGEERDDLRGLRDKLDVGEPVQLDKSEYQTFQRVVLEGAKKEKEQLKGMDANIFGDAEKQREIADEAMQGIFNNPPKY